MKKSLVCHSELPQFQLIKTHGSLHPRQDPGGRFFNGSEDYQRPRSEIFKRPEGYQVRQSEILKLVGKFE